MQEESLTSNPTTMKRTTRKLMPKSKSLNSMSTSTEASSDYITDWESRFYELNIMILKIEN
jgi:hypothetical protein